MNVGGCRPATFRQTPLRGRGKGGWFMAVVRWKVMIQSYSLAKSFVPRSLLRPATIPAFLSAASSLRIRSMDTSTGDGRCNQVEQHDLDSIFKEKRLLRSKVRKALKSMDPVQRSREGILTCNLVLIFIWTEFEDYTCKSVISVHGISRSKYAR